MPTCQPWEKWTSQRNKEEEQKDTAKLTAHGSKGGRSPVTCSGQEEKDDLGFATQAELLEKKDILGDAEVGTMLFNL